MRSGFVLLFLLLPFQCFAWSGRGHAVIAQLAEANLRPAVREQVRALLAEDMDRYERLSGRKTLAAVASWPDEIRDVARKNDPKAFSGWHARANQVCSSKLGRCKAGNCVDQLIIRHTAILRDRDQPLRLRNEALKWVVHLVGDLHMPLHSGVNRNGGGAGVRIEGMELKADATFHSVWDKELLHAALIGWKPQLHLQPDLPLTEDAPTLWMIEARDVALHEVYESLPGFTCEGRLPEPFVLDHAYQQRSVATVRQQLERAAQRLARLLNENLAE